MGITRRFACSLAGAALLFIVLAQPASAHAILLETEPAPQTTVPKAPAEVRLFFSEAVEVSFGAVRVFDVDAHRVDLGDIRRAQSNRMVVVPVRHLADGTYTVTWRVVSADGHQVHGGFGFYIGAPSTISTVAVPSEQGAGRVVGWGFGIVRFLWFAAFLALVGTVVVRRFVFTPATLALSGLRPALAAAGTPEGPHRRPSFDEAARRFRQTTARVLLIGWVVLVVAGAASMVFEAASVSGLSLASAGHWSVVREMLHTSFGRYLAWQLVLSVVLALPVWALARRRRLAGIPPDVWIGAGAVVAAGISVASALNGHARTLGHPLIGVASLAVHLLAVGAWVGGLGALVISGALAWRSLESGHRAQLVRAVVPRFSRVAIASVAAVVVTGTINAVADLASVSDLWKITYGRVVLAKIVLLLVALALGARHLWSVPPAIDRDGPAGVRSFQRSAAVELAVLTAVVALAAGLVALVPGRSLALAAQGPVNLEKGAAGYTVQVFLDPSRLGANEVHVTFVSPQGLAAAEVANASATLMLPGGASRSVDLRLISPGHFVGDASLGAVGRYGLRTSGMTGAARLDVQFSFRLTARSGRS